MILTPENIRDAILTLWGPGRLHELAAKIPCSVRTVHRWAYDGAQPQVGHAGALRRAIEERCEEVGKLIERIAA